MNKEHEIRYAVEHKILPNLIFKERIKIINILTQKGPEILTNIFKDLSEEQKIETIYSEKDFEVKGYSILKDLIYVLDIKMPETKEVPDCSHIYVMFDMFGKNISYFTLEKMMPFFTETTDDIFVLCGWNEKGDHLNYGFNTTKETSEEEIIKKIYDIFVKSITSIFY